MSQEEACEPSYQLGEAMNQSSDSAGSVALSIQQFKNYIISLEKHVDTLTKQLSYQNSLDAIKTELTKLEAGVEQEKLNIEFYRGLLPKS